MQVYYNVVFALVFGAVLMLLAGLSVRRPRRDLGQIVKPAASFSAGTQAEAVVEKRRRSGGFLSRLEQEARKAGVNLKARDFVAVAVVVGCAGFVLGSLLGGTSVGLALSLGALAAPYVLLGRAKRQRAQVLSNQLEPVLMSVSASLRGGASLAQAVGRAAEAAPAPVRDVVAQIDRAVRLGATPAEAIEDASKTVDSREWLIWAVSTAVLARAGGNLADVYDRLVETVRDRKAFRQQLRALTAQTRMSATVVSLFPVGAVALVRLVNPAYYGPMLATWTGRAVFFLSLGAIAVGWLIIQRMLGGVPEEG
ncbi:MAG: type II secretion system F family protein [Bacillota bacterium]